MISMDMLHDAQQVLAPVISRTPMVSTKGIVPGCDFYLEGRLPAKDRRVQAPRRVL